MDTGAFQLERLHAISLHSGILLRKKDIAKLLWRRLFSYLTGTTAFTACSGGKRRTFDNGVT
jgi:hypothetical protein